MKPLRNGRYDAQKYHQAMKWLLPYFIAVMIVTTVALGLLVGLHYGVLPQKLLGRPRDLQLACVSCILLVHVFFSMYAGVIYGTDMRERKYYLADFPKGDRFWWVIPYLMVWLGFPFLLVSYICMERAKRHYQKADEIERAEREQEWALEQKTVKVKPEEATAIQTNLQICAQHCWEDGLFRHKDELMMGAEQTRIKIRQLEAKIANLQEALQPHLDKLEELTKELEYSPLDVQIGPALRESMEHCLEQLCAMPEVVKVRATWYDEAMLRDLQITLHLADSTDNPQYDCGGYQLTLTNDGADHYTCSCDCTRSGMTAQGEALDPERRGDRIVNDGRFEHEMRKQLQTGMIPETVQAIIKQIRAVKLGGLEPEELSEYYLLLAPLRDR